MHRKRLNRAIALGVVIALCGTALACKQKDQDQAEEPVRTVRSQQIFMSGGERVRTFSGTSKSGVEASLSFKVPGTLARLHVKVGDRIRKGQRIAELDPQDFALRVEQAEAGLTRARASARNAAADYSRTRALYENQNASKDDLDSTRARAESTRANVRSTIKELELARAKLSYTRLASPANCSIAEVPVEVNENVGAGRAIVRVVCGTIQEVEVGVPEGFIALITEGSVVTADFDAMPGRHFPAVVTKVGVAAGQTTTTFPVTVQLQEQVPGFRSGMAAEVTFRFEAGAGPSRMLVPSFAVGEDRGGRFVFIVEETEPGFGIVHRRPVTVGSLTPDGLEVLAGLSDGERIITAGVSRLQDGRRVKLEGSSDTTPSL